MTEYLEQQKLRSIASAYIQEGEKIALNAAYGGEWTDRGGGAMVREAQAFLAGLDGRLPEGWQKFAEEIERNKAQEREQSTIG